MNRIFTTLDAKKEGWMDDYLKVKIDKKYKKNIEDRWYGLEIGVAREVPCELCYDYRIKSNSIKDTNCIRGTDCMDCPFARFDTNNLANGCIDWIQEVLFDNKKKLEPDLGLMRSFIVDRECVLVKSEYGLGLVKLLIKEGNKLIEWV